MNRGYYKQGQPSKVPYLLVLVILILLYIMNNMYDDLKDANHMVEQVMIDFPKNDSIKKIHKKETDSLKAVINWYKKQEEEKNVKKPNHFTNNKTANKTAKPIETKVETKAETKDTL